jgi:hypothetical protein
MTRFRSHWLALLGGALLLALSVSSAFAAKPAGDESNRGQQVSAFVHELVSGTEDSEDQPDDDADENADEDADEDADEAEDDEVVDEEPLEDSEPGDHGACVAAVAMDPEQLGGDNENHGGAVSLAARYTCWGLELPTDEESSTDADLTTSSVKEHGKSATAHERGRGHGKGHNH